MGEHDDKIKVELTPKQQGVVWRLQGAAEVLSALDHMEKRGPCGPGFALAKAIAEKEVADLRVLLAQSALRAAAAAGHDIGRTPGVFTSIVNGVPVLLLSPPDLISEGSL